MIILMETRALLNHDPSIILSIFFCLQCHELLRAFVCQFGPENSLKSRAPPPVFLKTGLGQSPFLAAANFSVSLLSITLNDRVYYISGSLMFSYPKIEPGSPAEMMRGP